VSSSIERGQSCFSRRESARSASFGKDQSAIRKIERGKSDLSRNLAAGGYPPQTAGNHKVNDQEKIVLELDDDSLTHSPESPDTLSMRCAYWRIYRAQKERL